MDDKLLSLNIGRPVAWMLDPIDASNVLGVTYAFSITGEHTTVWYTETGEPAQEYKLVETWDMVVNPTSLARTD